MANEFFVSYYKFFQCFSRELCEVNARIMYRQSVVRSFPDKNRRVYGSLLNAFKKVINHELVEFCLSIEIVVEDAPNVGRLEVCPIKLRLLTINWTNRFEWYRNKMVIAEFISDWNMSNNLCETICMCVGI